MELDLSELEEIIETQKLNIKMEDAAAIIQKNFRRFIKNKREEEFMAL